MTHLRRTAVVLVLAAVVLIPWRTPAEPAPLTGENATLVCSICAVTP